MPDPIQPLLDNAERILWRGRPIPKHTPPDRSSLIAVLSFAGAGVAIAGAGVTVYAFIAAVRHEEHIEATFLFALMLVAVTLALASVRFAFRRLSPDPDIALRTHYAITTRRVLVALEGEPAAAQWLVITQRASVSDSLDTRGCGTVHFRSGADDDDANALVFDEVPDALGAVSAFRSVLAEFQ